MLFPHHPGDTLGFPRSRIPAPNPMNYRHAFHAGNHADVLKHVALLALCDALVAKPSACFALDRSEEHTSELQSLMRISYAVFCLQKKNTRVHYTITYKYQDQIANTNKENSK